MRRFAAVLVGSVCAAVAFAVMAPGASAREPAPGFDEFFGCPEPPAIIDHCVVSRLGPIELELGDLRMTIDRPVLQNGGVPPGSPAPFVFNERGGLFAPRVPLHVRRHGHLRGFTGELRLAGTVVAAVPLGSRIPVKIAVQGPGLGKGCSIGSDDDPIVLDVTSGTTSPPPPNQPITGRPPGFGPHPTDPGKQVVTDGVMVDNAFAAPGAHGCVFHRRGRGHGRRSHPANFTINRIAGLPSAPGTNTATIGMNAVIAMQPLVYPPSA